MGSVINPNNAQQVELKIKKSVDGMALGISMSDNAQAFILALDRKLCRYDIPAVCTNQDLIESMCSDFELSGTGVGTDIAFSQDGEYMALATQSGEIALFQSDGHLIRSVRMGGNSPATNVAFNSIIPVQFASANSEGRVSLWDIYGQEMAGFPAHQSEVTQLSFTPQSQWLVSSGKDNLVHIWDIITTPYSPTLVATLDGHTDDVRALAFHWNGPDPIIATGGDDGVINIWQLTEENTNQWEKILILRSTTRVLSLAFSPDGRLLMQGGADGTIRLWDAANGKELTVLGDHTGDTTGVGFIFNGRLIVSASRDNTVCLWGIPRNP